MTFSHAFSHANFKSQQAQYKIKILKKEKIGPLFFWISKLFGGIVCIYLKVAIFDHPTVHLPGTRKALGPDRIPAEVIMTIARERPYLLLNMFNACLLAGIFGQRWKRQILVLLDKGKGPPITPSSFRPLCMLDNVGKVFEKLLRAKLRSAVTLAVDLSQSQRGFRKGCSTIGAIKEVLESVTEASQGDRRTRDTSVLVARDVKNAFYSVRWVDILDALGRFGVPAYLRSVLGDYLRNKELLYDTTEAPRLKKITAGVCTRLGTGPGPLEYDV